ncbi:putative transposase of the Rover4 hAT-like family [Lachancea fermentati]|uniref:Putative transposase of the Rover4 hAT-like family n=1 Tax=Lachancea fermentati TaxID=4955 RepID=A0A1G4MHN8_LACFM|nr:putative transposase of the Rover4 hAT-like family [Lachancea fermentati]
MASTWEKPRRFVSAQNNGISAVFEQQMPATEPAQPRSRSESEDCCDSQTRARPDDEGAGFSRRAPGAKSSASGSCPSGWMLKSSLRSFFDVRVVDARKEARCIYCGKRYPERESTGNMAKHVRALHPAAWSAKNAGVSKRQEAGAPRTAPPKHPAQSLQVSGWIRGQREHNAGVFHTATLAAEQFLPLSFVQSVSWTRLSDSSALRPSVKSTATLVQKLGLFSQHMNETLASNLENSQFANILVKTWTAPHGEALFAVMVSFAPNIWSDPALEAANDPRILFNNSGAAQNTHLLDFSSFGAKMPNGEYLCEVLISLLHRYNLAGKVSTITMDSAVRNGSLFTSLVFDHFGASNPFAHRLFGRVRYIRCAAHVLDLQFERIAAVLLKYAVFSKPYRKIQRFAESTRSSPRLSACLREQNIPPMPAESLCQWTSAWSQLSAFLANFRAYRTLCEQLLENGHQDLAREIQENIEVDKRALELFKYFVGVFELFNDMSMKLRQDDFNHLANGVPIFYLLDHFYKICAKASNGSRISKSRAGFDFSCINGSSDLQAEDREVVFDAIKLADATHQEYMCYFRANSLYYVAFLLDPAAKEDAMYKMMSAEEAAGKMLDARLFIEAFLKESGEADKHHGPTAIEKPFSLRLAPSLHFDLNDLSTDENPHGDTNHSGNVEAGENSHVREWITYLRASKPPLRTKDEAIKWWYAHRQNYPQLFKLAISLFYTKLSTHDLEMCFSLPGRVMRRNGTGHKTFKTLVLLRDRFSKFGFFDQAPESPDGVTDHFDDLMESEALVSDGTDHLELDYDEEIYHDNITDEDAIEDEENSARID